MEINFAGKSLITSTPKVTALGVATALAFVYVVTEIVVQIGAVMSGVPVAESELASLGVGVAFHVALAAVGLAYLFFAGYGLEYIDSNLPSTSDLLYGISMGVASAMIAFALIIGSEAAGIDVEGGGMYAMAETATVTWQFFVLWALVQPLVGAPVKAFFFLNLIQKRLHGPFTGLQAVLLTALLITLTYSLGAIAVIGEVGVAATVIGVGVLGIHAVLFTHVYDRVQNLFAAVATNTLYNILLVVIVTLVFM